MKLMRAKKKKKNSELRLGLQKLKRDYIGEEIIFRIF